jgi:autotransporter-associated beta strand protein
VNNTVNWQDTNSNPSVFNFGDPVTFDDTGAGGTVALTGSYLSAASVMVDSESGYVYSFTGSGGFAGPGSLIYKGPGQLTLNNINTYSGGTIISNANALLYLQNYGGLGTGPVTLAKAGGKMEIVSTGSASSGINGNIIVADDFSIQVDGVGTYATVFFGDFSGVSGKTLTFNPKDLTTTNRFRAYGVNTIYNANMVLNGPATSQANYNGSVLAPYNASGTQTYNGIISGNGGIVERGNGTTILNGPNTYSGGTTPTTGNIGFGIDTVGAVTSGPIGTGPLYLSPEIPSATGSGTVFASGGAHTIANPIQYPSATNNLTLIIGGTNDLTFTGPVTLNGIDSLGSMTNRTLQVTNTGLTTISGVISDGGAGFELIKTGAGTLALNNTETYTGSTTNSAGMLLINGSLAAASALTVSTNATLAGTGTINGTVLVNAGGILAAGTNTIGTIGTLTINNNLTLLGNVFIKVNRFVSPSNDVISVSQVLTNAGVGTLTVTNLGPTIVAGNRFTLFNKALTNGFALTVTGGGISWSNRLGIDGSILALGPSVATNPTNILFSIIGGTNLALSWPADHLGWYLQVQTNALSIGLQTNSSLWFDVPNSSNVDSTNILINPKNPTVFYRLSLQP